MCAVCTAFAQIRTLAGRRLGSQEPNAVLFMHRHPGGISLCRSCSHCVAVWNVLLLADAFPQPSTTNPHLHPRLTLPIIAQSCYTASTLRSKTIAQPWRNVISFLATLYSAFHPGASWWARGSYSSTGRSRDHNQTTSPGYLRRSVDCGACQHRYVNCLPMIQEASGGQCSVAWMGTSRQSTCHVRLAGRVSLPCVVLDALWHRSLAAPAAEGPHRRRGACPAESPQNTVCLVQAMSILILIGWRTCRRYLHNNELRGSIPNEARILGWACPAHKPQQRVADRSPGWGI